MKVLRMMDDPHRCTTIKIKLIRVAQSVLVMPMVLGRVQMQRSEYSLLSCEFFVDAVIIVRVYHIKQQFHCGMYDCFKD